MPYLMLSSRKFATRSSLITAARLLPTAHVPKPPPAAPSSARWSTKLMCGFTCDTRKLLQLNSSVSLAAGMSAVMVPSKEVTPADGTDQSPVTSSFANSSDGASNRATRTTHSPRCVSRLAAT